MDPFDRVCHLLGAEPRSNQAMARCPAHEDRQASLSVSRGDKGVVLHCHAGCDTRAITEALGLRMSELFNEGPAPRERAEMVATYNYVDEMGELLYRVIRYSNKDFRQRAANGAWSVKGIRKVPYRLPEVLDAIRRSETIWIAEGEKDVDALWKANAPATCNSGGAGKWTPEHAQAIAGAAEVVIVADKDAAGTAHAKSVQASLEAVGVEATIVQAAIGKDAADHLGAGKGLDEFVPLEAETAAEAPAEDGLPRPLDWAAFWADDPSDAEWLCEPFLPKGRLTTIQSAPKAGKSLITLEVAVKMAMGVPVFHRPASEPMNVVYFDFEMTDNDLRERLVDMGIGPDDDLSHFHYYLLPSLPPADTPEGGKAILDICRRHEAELAVIDTMARVVAGEEQAADTYRSFYRWTAMHLKAEGITVLLIDHLGKDPTKGGRGSSEKAGYVDLVWQLSVGDGGMLTLKATHRRMGWVDEQLVIERKEMPLLAHVLERKDVYPPGTKELVELCRRAEVTIDMTVSAACTKLKNAGTGRRKKDVAAALRWMKAELPTFGTSAGSALLPGSSVPGTAKNGSQFPTREPLESEGALTSTGTAPEPQEPGFGTDGVPCSPLYGEPDPSPDPDETDDQQNVKDFDPLEFF